MYTFSVLSFELHIALCVLGLKEMSVNLTENALVIFCQDIIHFSSDFFLKSVKSIVLPNIMRNMNIYTTRKKVVSNSQYIYKYIYIGHILYDKASLRK